MKYRFEVTYQPKYLREACKLMNRLDFPDFCVGLQTAFTFTSQKDLTIQQVKECIRIAFGSDDCTILHMEGGVVE